MWTETHLSFAERVLGKRAENGQELSKRARHCETKSATIRLPLYTRTCDKSDIQ